MSSTRRLPTSTSAIVLRQFGRPPLIEQLSLSPLQPDEALIKVHATGVCHTDLICMDGQLPVSAPVVLGHEGLEIRPQALTSKH